MKTYRITYTDGTTEDVTGFQSFVSDGLLKIEQGQSSFNRAPRFWPLTSIRSWEVL